MKGREILMMIVGGLMVVSCGRASSSETTQPETTTSTNTSSTATTAAPTTAPVEQTMAPATTDGIEAGGWTESDVVYATRISDGKTVMLDVHLPAEIDDAPIVLEGDEQLVEQGMIVVNGHETDSLRLAVGPEELVADRVSVRSYAELFGCEIRLARDRASQLGNDDPIVIIDGFSLFGGLAVQVGLFGDTLDARWDEFADAGGPPRQFDCAVKHGSTDVDAVIGTAGTYDLSMPIVDGAYGRAYHQEHDPDMQEFLASAIGANPDLKIRLIHGTNDGIPVEMAEEFAATLSDAGYDVQLTTWSGEHEGAPADIYVPTLMEALDR